MESHNRQREQLGTWKGWLTVLVVTFAGIVVMMNQFKVPPVTRDLMDVFFVDSGTAGWLTSVFSLTGLVLAIPGAFIFRKAGPKGTGMIALGATIVGVTIGATTDSFVVLLISRIIEGTGVALMGVVGPSTIALYFNRAKSGLPMGIWNIWYTGGSVAAYNVAIPIAKYFGAGSLDWHVIWWFGDIMALVTFLLVAVVVSRPKATDVIETAPQVHEQSNTRLIDAFKVKRIWILAVAFMLLVFAQLSFMTWAPTYFRDVYGMDPALAASKASMGYLWSIPASIVCGLLLNRFKTIKQRNLMLLICAICELAIYPWCFLVPEQLLHVYLFCTGFATGFTAACVWSSVPLTMPVKSTIPIGMGLMQTFKSAANLFGTPIIGYIVQVGVTAQGAPIYNWSLGCIPIAIASVIAIALMITYVKMKPETFEEEKG